MLLLLLAGCLINKDLYEDRLRELSVDSAEDGSGVDTAETTDTADSGDSGDTADTSPPDVDGDGWSLEEDCDDADSSVHPEAVEFCDGVDQDCDEQIDDDADDQEIWYVDGDGDGWGDPTSAREACFPEAGEIVLGDDCDDQDPTVFPGAQEYVDAEDEDCSGTVDDLLYGRDLILWTSPVSYGRAGAAILAHDLDGDGTTELYVAAPGRDSTSDLANVFVVTDAAAGGELTEVFTSGEAGSRLGSSLIAWEGAIAFGAPGDFGGDEGGGVLVIENDGTMHTWTLDGSVSRAGGGLSRAGDIDGDGRDELFVGADGYSALGTGIGAAWLVQWDAPDGALADIATVSCFGEDLRGHFGGVLSGGIDANDDGYDDWLASAPQGEGDATESGEVYVFTTTSLDCTPADAWLTLSGAATDDHFGSALRADADLDGDGLTEILVGASGADDGATDGGAVYVFENLHPGTLAASGADGRLVGADAAVRVGDALGDGDAPWSGATSNASAWLLADLGLSTPTDELASITGEPASEFGAAIASGAFGAPATDSEAGAVYVLP